jgi:hypothetical protein
MRLEAAAAFEVGRTGFIASHDTAAALWEIPRIRPPDGLVHMRVTKAAGTRTESGIRKHAVQDTELHLVTLHGIPCTDLERTVVDLAMTARFDEAVVAADWALRTHTSKEALQRTLDELAPVRGRRAAQRVIDFANPLAQSPGESLSRAQMAEQGLTIPLLQARFEDRAGLIGFVDFYWPDFNLIGEFDGLQKYSDPAMLAGRTPAQAVIEEKHREDRLRATETLPRVTRWIWSTLRTRGGLGDHLRAAGVR